MDGVGAAQAAWTTADYALIVSLFSAGLALLSFGWNVWSKFIFPKPKVRLWADIQFAHLASGHSASIRRNGTFAGDLPPAEMELPALSLEVTNYGPGEVIISNALVKLPLGHPRRKEGHGLLVAYNDYPRDLTGQRVSSGGLPKKLANGETFNLCFPLDCELFDHKITSRIGIRDTLSRFSWVSSKNMRHIHAQYRACLERQK